VGALLITSAVYMGALEKLDIDATGWHKLWKGIGLILLVYGALVLAGIASGGKDVLQPCAAPRLPRVRRAQAVLSWNSAASNPSPTWIAKSRRPTPRVRV